jgi:ABC-type Mn2+/Zn2+ transport system permease subunit
MAIKRFLIILGIGAVLYSLAGFFHVIGPDAAHSIFGKMWWLDNTENWTHLIAGVVSLVFAFYFSDIAQEIFAWIMSFLSIGVSVYSIIAPYLLNRSIEDPVEQVIYFTAGNIAIWSMLYQMQKQRKAEMDKLQQISSLNKNL